MSIPVSVWKPVVEAAQASRRADCGHRFAHLFYLRVEKAGDALEVYSVCISCRVGTDYTVLDDAHPHRTLHQKI